jgi:penicillin G amidase
MLAGRRPRLRGGAAVLVAAALVVTAAPAGAEPAKPANGVVRDQFGLVHVRAANRHDLFFLQGWVHAQDRLFQMDLNRREPSGTLAELLGARALPQDIQIRTLGVRRAAQRSLAALSASTRRDLDSYTEGVNRWVAHHPLPAQYAAAGARSFAPWQPVDSVTALKWVSVQVSLFDGLRDMSSTAALQAAVTAGEAGGFDGAALFAEDAYRSQPFTGAASVPDATRASPPSAISEPVTRARVDPGRLAGAARLSARWLTAVQGLDALAPLLQGEHRRGSNEWVVSGARTTTGMPLLVNDPHLRLVAPSTFYPIHLQGAGFDVVGDGFAGVPYVVLGQNRHIAWGATTNPMDVADTYFESVVPDPASPTGLSTVYQGAQEPVLAVPEVFHTLDPATGAVTVVPPGGDVPAATLIVPRRNQGPILQLDVASGSGLSLQYTGFNVGRELDAVALFDTSRDVDQFRDATTRWDVGSQNWSYADRAGHIAYLTSAEMPVREDLQAGTVHGLPPYFVRDGSGGNEWLAVRTPQRNQAVPYEILPPAEMPHVVDPAAGFVVNANNDPAGTTLDNDPLNQTRPGGGIYYLNDQYDGLRAGRVTELLNRRIAAGKVGVADMARIQADVGLIDAEVLAPHLVAAFDRAQRTADPTLRSLGAGAAVAEAAGRLRGWDFTTPTGVRRGFDAGDTYREGVPSGPSAVEETRSVNATIYSAWRSQIVRDAVDAPLASLGVPPPGSDTALADLRALLESRPQPGVGASGVDFFAVPGVSDHAVARDVVLLRSLARALDALAGPDYAPAFGGSHDQRNYRWGKLHRIVFDSPLGAEFSVPRVPGPFPPSVPGLPGLSVDGAYGTVDAAYHNVRATTPADYMYSDGPARRYIGEMTATGPRGFDALAGEVNDAASGAGRSELLSRYLVNDHYPLLF